MGMQAESTGGFGLRCCVMRGQLIERAGSACRIATRLAQGQEAPTESRQRGQECTGILQGTPLACIERTCLRRRGLDSATVHGERVISIVGTKRIWNMEFQFSIKHICCYWLGYGA